jgi:hypothetical protein
MVWDPRTISVESQAAHQGISVIKEPDHHENLGDLGISVAELLHGSSVELQSGGAIIEGGDDHSNNFFDRLRNPAPFHNRFILLPVRFQVVRIVSRSAKIHGHKRSAEDSLDLIVDLAYASRGDAFRYELDGGHTRLLLQTPDS